MVGNYEDDWNYGQIEIKDWDSKCPRCESQARKVLPPSPLGGIATAINSYKCLDCGLFFDVVPNYDCW
jgi:transposase-like protein